MWLVGGLNPSAIHDRMKNDADFQSRFFTFFEDLIHHHLPDVDLEVSQEYEPKVERPPLNLNINTKNPIMQEEVKRCGEVLQRHKCRPVCHKYGHDNDCRFNFPHELVEKSSFHAETNSILLRCLDSTVNYFNPIILTLCRHNHDIKCILSGKSAKAAIFYITDYITKMDHPPGFESSLTCHCQKPTFNLMPYTTSGTVKDITS
jgi:hypothetical protein